MKYKVDDEAFITHNINGHEFNIGDKVKIVDIIVDTYVATDDNGGLWHITDDDLKPIEEDKPKEAARYNSGKVEFHDTPVIGLMEVAKVAAYGRAKYSIQNWRGEAKTSQYLNCALRHMFKYLAGENIDDESKCTHLGHAAWNILALIEKIQMGKDIDDRFKYESDTVISDLFKLKGD